MGRPKQGVFKVRVSNFAFDNKRKKIISSAMAATAVEVKVHERRPALYVQAAVEEIALDGPSGIFFLLCTKFIYNHGYYRDLTATIMAITRETIRGHQYSRSIQSMLFVASTGIGSND